MEGWYLSLFANCTACDRGITRLPDREMVSPKAFAVFYFRGLLNEDQLELGRLFEREIGRLGPFQDLVHQHGGLLKGFHIVHPAEISPPASTNCRKLHRGYPAASCKLDDP